MDDNISRQAAIKALGEKPLAWTEGEYELGLQNQWQSDVDALNGLPSAQPEIIHCCDCIYYDPEHIEKNGVRYEYKEERMTNEKTIELLDNLVGMVSDNHDNDYDAALKTAIQVLKESQWILCGERLPRKHETVIVTIKGHDVIIPMAGESVEDAIDRINKATWVSVGFLGSDGWYGADGYPMTVQPVAWRPLPGPCEVGSDV